MASGAYAVKLRKRCSIIASLLVSFENQSFLMVFMGVPPAPAPLNDLGACKCLKKRESLIVNFFIVNMQRKVVVPLEAL